MSNQHSSIPRQTEKNTRQQAVPDKQQSGSGSWQLPTLPGLLRYAGTFLVVISGLIFLLHGLEQANLEIRYWTYLLFILILAGGGLFSHKYMSDSKGARLFFGLATLLVIIQFTQLGAMIYDWINPAESTTELTLGRLVLFAGLTMLLGGLASFVGLTILARPYAKKLALSFILLNSLLLLPERNWWAALLLAAVMATIYLLLNHTVFKNNYRFQVLEGQAVKAMLLLPVTIVIVRAGFHLSIDMGIGLIILLSACAVFYFNRMDARPDRLAKIIAVAGFVLFSWGWVQVSYEIFRYWDADSQIKMLLMIMPLFAFSAKQDVQFDDGIIFRVLGSIVFAVYVLVNSFNSDVFGLALLSIVSTGVLIFAIQRHSIVLLLQSVIVLTLSLNRLFLLSLDYIDINVWLALAIAGIVLVTISSVIERYGHAIKARLIKSYTDNDWAY